MLQHLLPLAGAVLALSMSLMALVDILKRSESDFPVVFPGASPRLVWGFIVIVFSVAGVITYYLVVVRVRPR